MNEVEYCGSVVFNFMKLLKDHHQSVCEKLRMNIANLELNQRLLSDQYLSQEATSTEVYTDNICRLQENKKKRKMNSLMKEKPRCKNRL